MINKQFRAKNTKYSEVTKCPACKQDEKYVVWVTEGNEAKEVRVCAKQCGIDKKKKKEK